MGFDETKQKIKEQIEQFRSELELMGLHVSHATMVLENNLLAVLGDLQKTVKWLECYPKAVCLVGSTHPKWKKRYRQVEEELTKAGYVVLTVVWFKDQLPKFESHRDLLERIHFQKIRLANAVVLIHKDAVGKHTAMEMEFAEKIGRKVVVFDTIEKAEKLLETTK